MKDVNVPAGYKSTDIGIIPEDWEVKLLKSISSMNGRIGWQGLKQEEFTTNNSDPFLITGMNFKDGKIRWNEVYHIPYKRYQEAKNIQLQEDDILMTKDGTIGKLLYVDKIPFPGKASLNSHLLVFRPLSNAYAPKFLFYQLSSKQFFNYVDLNKSGSTFFGITQEAVGNYNAYLPPLPEQKAIARVLSDVDDLIREYNSLLAKKRDIKQGTMQQLLTGKKRLPGFSGEWEEKKLGDVLKVKHGKSQHHIVDEDGKYPILATGGQIGKTNTFLYDKPSVLIGRKGTIDVPQYTESPFWTIDTLFYTEIYNKAIPKFIFYKFNLINWYSYNEASGVPSLNAYTIENINSYFPPTLPEQRAIAQILSDMDAEIEALEQKRDKYKAIKQGMMQELLTGKTRLIENG